MMISPKLPLVEPHDAKLVTNVGNKWNLRRYHSASSRFPRRCRRALQGAVRVPISMLDGKAVAVLRSRLRILKIGRFLEILSNLTDTEPKPDAWGGCGGRRLLVIAFPRSGRMVYIFYDRIDRRQTWRALLKFRSQ
jgi:hypothetical protein